MTYSEIGAMQWCPSYSQKNTEKYTLGVYIFQLRDDDVFIKQKVLLYSQG